MPYKGREKTVGGVYVPDETRDRESVATVVAYVVKVGPLAYKTLINLGRIVSRGVKKGIGYVSVDTPDPDLSWKVAR